MGGRVLVVDDDHDNVRLVKRVLQRDGFEVTTADDATTALAALGGQRPDAVLLDVIMPGVSGLDLLKQIRSRPALAKLPVILITARSKPGDMIEGYNTGADYYITKPFTPRQLLHGLHLALSGASSG